MAEKDAGAGAPEIEYGYECDLEQPIEAHGETVKRLKFRKPTARDLITVGNPVIFDPIAHPPKVTHDERKMRLMISTLANIPTSSVDAMNPTDWITCAWGITPFFMPVPGKI